MLEIVPLFDGLSPEVRKIESRAVVATTRAMPL
jgi:hypothetical protein